MNIDRSLPRVEIGSTWNRRSAQGTGTNAESKLLRARSRTKDGSPRDTAVYSIIASEWPQVRSSLGYRLARRSGT